jgi:integrase/recombinase XerD
MKWEAKVIRHRGENRIAVLFEKNATLIARIKQLEGSRWSQSLKIWHLPDTITYREQFHLPSLASTLPNKEGQQAIEKFKQHLRSKRYSESTVATYSDGLRSFLVFYNTKPIADITNEDVIVYNNDFILKNGLSASYQNQVHPVG